MDKIDFEALKNAMFLVKSCDDGVVSEAAMQNYSVIALLYIEKYGQELMDESHKLILKMFE